MEYHVSKTGADLNPGTMESPFLTISRAAKIAVGGDRIIVHEGVYRECVSPANGARTANDRIIYEAAENEKVIIKGSEVINSWQKNESGKWTAAIPNDFFGDYNPYNDFIDGDWFLRPLYTLHTGAVYINGKALKESVSPEDIENETLTWCCKVTADETIIYADFGTENPNDELTEINVRRSCFMPKYTGINYITVRGFEMAHAATQWAPPTAEQIGMIFTNWSKGWIIENNILHDSRCSAVSVGKEKTTGHNLSSRYLRKPGYQEQLESVFAARHIGWSKERIGSHIIRNNTIYDCGQNGIVGHMGGAFSEIYNNNIYNIGHNHEFFGYEIAGIKLHAAIDVKIYNNRIHHCGVHGTWLDWQAQGVRLTRNLYYDNDGTDLFIEVSHGPYMVDNNIFASKHSLLNHSQGGAYVHNLFLGATRHDEIKTRSTPYHLPHSTEIRGCALVYGGDDRFFQNIFVGGSVSGSNGDYFTVTGTSIYNGHTTSIEEYSKKIAEIVGRGDAAQYQNIPDPVYISGNCYMSGAASFEKEENKLETEFNPEIKILEENGNIYLEANIPDKLFDIKTKLIKTSNLPLPRINDIRYENADGTELSVNTDFSGNSRSDTPVPGPFENLKPGKQKILIFKM